MDDKSFEQEKDLLDDENEQKPIYMMSVEEKEHYVVYDDDGTPNFYDREENTWKPVKAFVSREDILKAKSNYPLPRIYPYRIFSRFVFPFVVGGLSTLIVYLILSSINQSLGTGYYFLIFGCVSMLDILLHLGDFVILCVQLYQKHAPDHVRERCHMHPSCSFYCIYAIMKYGALIGIIKAIGRLCRCEGQEEDDEP